MTREPTAGSLLDRVIDEGAVLIADGGVIAWNIRTGQLSLVAQLLGGPEGVPIGYDAVGDLRP